MMQSLILHNVVYPELYNTCAAGHQERLDKDVGWFLALLLRVRSVVFI